MYCKQCNSYNDDNCRFCSQCGAELESPREQSSDAPGVNENNASAGYAQTYSNDPVNQYENQYGGQQYNGGYAPQYQNQPYFGAQPQAEPTPPLNNTMAVVSIVLNVVVFNVIGLVFAILSLTNYNSYEAALRIGNIMQAEQLKAKSKKYSKIAIIVVIIVAVLSVIGFIAAFVGGFFLAASEEMYPADFMYEFEEYMLAISALVR